MQHNLECLKQTSRSLIAFVYWSSTEIDHVYYYEIVSNADIYSLTLKYISVKGKKQHSSF